MSRADGVGSKPVSSLTAGVVQLGSPVHEGGEWRMEGDHDRE